MLYFFLNNCFKAVIGDIEVHALFLAAYNTLRTKLPSIHSVVQLELGLPVLEGICILWNLVSGNLKGLSVWQFVYDVC